MLNTNFTHPFIPRRRYSLEKSSDLFIIIISVFSCTVETTSWHPLVNRLRFVAQ